MLKTDLLQQNEINLCVVLLFISIRRRRRWKIESAKEMRREKRMLNSFPWISISL